MRMESGTTRLETFSDGVFAIAATLLILEIGVSSRDSHDLGSALLHLWPSYLAYTTSFITIGVIWMNHHTCVETMRRVDRTLLFLNLLLLLTVAFLPFPTKLVAQHLNKPGEQVAVALYAGTLVVMAVIYNVWWRYASTGRRLIADSVPDSRVRAISRAFDPGVPIYAITFAVAFVSPLASVILTFAIVAAVIVGNRSDSFWYGVLAWLVAMGAGRVLGALIRGRTGRAAYKALWPAAATGYALLFDALGLPPWASVCVAFIAASLTKNALAGLFPDQLRWTRTVEWRRIDLDELLP